jgi:hypothetical protein
MDEPARRYTNLKPEDLHKMQKAAQIASGALWRARKTQTVSIAAMTK